MMPSAASVDRFLREQLMTVRRHHGDRIEWERAQGIWPGLVRSLDFSKRYAFSLVTQVETICRRQRQRHGDLGDLQHRSQRDAA